MRIITIFIYNSLSTFDMLHRHRERRKNITCQNIRNIHLI